MTARRAYTRHGLTAPMVRVKLAGFSAIDPERRRLGSSWHYDVNWRTPWEAKPILPLSGGS